MLEEGLQQPESYSNPLDNGDVEAQEARPAVTYGLEDRLRDAEVSKKRGNELYKEKKY